MEKFKKYSIDYSVVIPVYNSTDSLFELVNKICLVFNTSIKATYEILLIDDCSTNMDTWKTMKSIADTNEQVTIIQLTRNFGKTGAVLCGFSNASGNYIFTMDDDLQHLPEEMPKFIEKQEHDVVMGIFKYKKHPLSKRITSAMKGWLERIILEKPSGIQMGPYRLHKASVVKSMIKIKTPYPFMPALLFNSTNDLVTVELTHGERKFGKSGYSFWKRFKTFSNLLINNSNLLLRLVAITGVLVACLSFILGGYYLFKYLIIGVSVPGWTTIVLFTLVLNGLVLFSLGVIGEYLIRIVRGVERRPSFLVRQMYRKEL